MVLACPVCERPNVRYLFSLRDYETNDSKLFPLYECCACTLIFVHPTPDFTELVKYYPPRFNCYSAAFFGAKTLWRLLYLLERRKLVRLLPRAGSAIFDVGCADASYMENLEGVAERRYGLEMNAEMAEAARRRLGTANVIEGFIEEMEIPFRDVDIVRINHVIEHFREPVLALQKMNHTLKLGGYLLGETPNTGCISRRLFGRYWGCYCVPRHLYLFNQESLRVILEKTGFELLRTENRLMTQGWSAAIQNILVDKVLRSVPARGRIHGYLGLIAVTVPITMVQRVVAQTPIMGFLARKVREVK